MRDIDNTARWLLDTRGRVLIDYVDHGTLADRICGPEADEDNPHGWIERLYFLVGGYIRDKIIEIPPRLDIDYDRVSDTVYQEAINNSIPVIPGYRLTTVVVA